MSIYIPGKPMPPNCAGCDFCADGWCYVISADQEQPGELSSDKRPDWCPLVEVPPHGRCIDADALNTKRHGNNSQRVMWSNIEMLLDAAPTVIPAEEEPT